ncbi:MAG TPA: hypothetical protein VNO74_07165 [Methylomirabilota bacterium]|nr:hypothetical protein [Methylomirabilota bacterium]
MHHREARAEKRIVSLFSRTTLSAPANARAEFTIASRNWARISGVRAASVARVPPIALRKSANASADANCERGLSAAGCYIEHAITGARSAQLNQAVVDPLSGALESWPPSFPGLRAIVPRELLFVFDF